MSLQSKQELLAVRRYRGEWPRWVRFVLYGVRGPGAGWISCGLLFGAGLGLVGYAYASGKVWAYPGAILILGAIAYYQALRWVDRHGMW